MEKACLPSRARRILVMQIAMRCDKRYLLASRSNSITLSKLSSVSRAPVWKYRRSKSKVWVVASETTTSAEAPSCHCSNAFWKYSKRASTERSKLDCETRQLDFETGQTDFETEIVKLRSQILKLNKRIVKLNTQIVKPVL